MNPNNILTKLQALPSDELVEILEAARIALTNERVAPMLGEEMDLTDEDLAELGGKVAEIMK